MTKHVIAYWPTKKRTLLARDLAGLGKLHIVEKQVNEESMRRSSCFLTFIRGLDYRKKSWLAYGLSRYWRES